MAFFDARFDVSSVKELERKLARLPRPVENEIRKSNRKWASKLRDLIRAEAAAIFGKRAKAGSRHDTPGGAWATAVKSKASGRNATVYGGRTEKAPHWKIQEFGGALYWFNSRGKGHVIPIGTRTNISSPNKSGNLRGSEGRVFYPTVHDHEERIVEAVAEDAVKIIHDMLAT